MNTILIRVLATLVIIAIAAFNAAFYTGLHLHVLPDGRTVVHSHPVNRNEEGENRHQHSEQEYVVLASLAKLLLTDEPVLDSDVPRLEPVFSPLESSTDIVNSLFFASQQDERSPPSITLREV
ncbi:MAG: hypothetical protein ABIE70_12255 [bacterium]